MKSKMIKVDAETHQAAKIQSAKRGQTLQAYIKTLVEKDKRISENT